MITVDSNAVALITGASSGIGAATALHFADIGYRCLSLSGRDREALDTVRQGCIDRGATQVIVTIGDVTDSATIRELIDNTIKTFGRLDTLINAVGILVSAGTVADTDIVEYDRQFQVNVRSVVQLTQLAVPHLITTKGTIVNVSSIAGICAFPNVTYYCMSKAAIDQFTKCLALELASSGVRVNAVNPGVIETNVHKRAGMTNDQYSKFLEHSKTTHAMGRIGQPDEVAQAIAFLAGRQSSFTTGDLLRIDGGRGIMTPR